MDLYVEIILFTALLYWIWPNLFIEGASRIRKMVDVVTNRMIDSFNRFAPREKQQNDTLSSISNLKRFSMEQRARKILTREAETQLREKQLYEIKESLPPIAPLKSRPLAGLTCYSCTPISRESLVNKTTRNLGLKNILKDHPSIKQNGLLYNTVPDLLQSFSNKTFTYQQVAGAVLKDERVKAAIEKSATQQFQESDVKDEEYFRELLKNNGNRARKLLQDMRSTMSDFLLKITAWIMYKILPCFLSSVVVHSGQIQMLKEASKSGLPLIFLPLHRSHLDYVMISFILKNNSVRCPLIAAGDNLRIPIFGGLLRGLGAFYIKRRMDPVMGQKDYLYKAILHSYMTAGLTAGHNLEFFLEGGRTRTGKPLMPKYGVFSIVVDAFMTGAIEDALLVPVSVNYDKIVDGNFVREQLGQPKQMETFGSAIKAIWQVLNSNYGMVRIDFNQPFSFRELVKTFNGHKVDNGVIQPKKLKSNPSTTSLYGTDVVVEEYQQLVEKITKHVMYDCVRSTSVMSTNAVAFLLLHKFRKGVKLSLLSESLDELRSDLEGRQKDCGFSGDSVDIILYSLDIFGPNLIKKEIVDKEEVIKPSNEMANIIELNYYSNTLTTFYALEAAIALSLYTLNHKSGFVSQTELIAASVELCTILQYEFIFFKPCQNLENAITDSIEDLIVHKEVFLTEQISEEEERSRRLAERLFEDEEQRVKIKEYQINYDLKANNYLLFLKGLLLPLIESYSVTASCLEKLVGQSLLESDLIKEVLNQMQLNLSDGDLVYDESVSSDSIRNALKLFHKWNIVESHNEGKLKLYYLQEENDNLNVIDNLRVRLDKFRYGFK